MIWYILVRRNDPKDQLKENPHLTPEEIKRNENLPILVHWDKDQLPKPDKQYYIKEIEI